jgi:hypothetical protein
MKTYKILFIAAFFCVFSFSLRAQDQIEQYRQFQANPTLNKGYNGEKSANDQNNLFTEAPSSPGDEDLGDQQILREKQEKFKSFTLFGDASGFYTDNASLTKTGKQSDFFTVETVGASYQIPINPQFFADITGSVQSFRYNQQAQLDFYSMSGGPGLTYVIPELWDTAVFGRYTYTRLIYSNDDNSSVGGYKGDEFYKDHDLTFGLQKVFQFSKAHYAYIGHTDKIGMTDWHDTTGFDPQRNEYALFGGYVADLSRWFKVQLGYRAAYEDYTEQGNRADLNQVVSTGFTAKLCEYATFNGSFAWTFNNSNWAANDYQAITSGVGLSVNVKF